MAAFILDASVAISWCFPGDPTEDTPYSRRVLGELVANDAIVPETGRLKLQTAFSSLSASAGEFPSNRSPNTCVFSRPYPSA
jgi:hypothetical protein